MRTERRRWLRGLGGNLAVFILLPVALNGAIRGVPPGWVVGVLWTLLFAGMGIARWLLVREGSVDVDWRVAESVSLLAFLCLLYPLYTAGLRDLRVGEVGNIATAVVAIAVAWLAGRQSRGAGLCCCAVALWLAYAATVTGMTLLHG
jgi:tryptophan-rich sensory protein